MDKHLISYYIGICIVFFSHLFTLLYPEITIMSMKQHSYLNILGGLCIAYYFMNKENFIDF